MSYDDIEVSEDDGDAVELYTFSSDAITTLRQTTAAETISLDGDDYSPAAIRRSAVEVSTDILADHSITLDAPTDHAIVALFRSTIPPDPITLRIVRKHRSESETEGVWLGFIRSVTWSDGRPQMHGEPIPASLKRAGLRIAYTRGCPYQLYDENTCRVVAASFTVSGTVSAFSGLTVSAPEFATKPDGWFTGGEAVFGGSEVYVDGHTGDTLTLRLPFTGLSVGDSIDARAGCDRSKATCIAKFNNLANYGGQPWIPDKNPFSVGLEG